MLIGVLADDIKPRALDEMLAVHPWDRLEFGLFKGSTVPDRTTSLGDLTEQDGTGYARQSISGWTPAVLLGDGHAYSEADDVSFTNSGGGSWDETTGWFWVDSLDDTLVMARRFLGPFVLPAGETYTTTPRTLETGE